MILIKPISPVAIDIFGFEIRWYAVSYILAFIAGLWLIKKLANEKAADKKYWDDLFACVVLGTIMGGRLGYVLFYNLSFFIRNPMEIFAVWNGGMSFHGGLIGVIAAAFLFSRKQSKKENEKWKMENGLAILDLLAAVAPVGLFFGRIANFINMEVMGRITGRPWGVAFEGAADILPRHPSPLYEAAAEGALLFVIMLLLRPRMKGRAGALSAMFGILYGVFRIFCEQFREPDVQIGFLYGTDWLTMGMLLSIAMIVMGLGLLARAYKDKLIKTV